MADGIDADAGLLGKLPDAKDCGHLPHDKA